MKYDLGTIAYWTLTICAYVVLAATAVITAVGLYGLVLLAISALG